MDYRINNDDGQAKVVFTGDITFSENVSFRQLLKDIADQNVTSCDFDLSGVDMVDSAGLGMFDTMNQIRPDVCTICLGLAASMGAFLLSAGAKGKRMSLPHSRIMIHQPLGGAQGQATDIEIQAKEILYLKQLLNGHLASHTGQPLERIEEDTERDFFMSPQEALEYGIIDQVIDHRPSASNPPA